MRNLPVVAGPLKGADGEETLSDWQHGRHIDSMPKELPQKYIKQYKPLSKINAFRPEKWIKK